jgi:hypothetical protein
VSSRVKAPSTPKLVSTVIEYRDAEIFKPMDFLDWSHCSSSSTNEVDDKCGGEQSGDCPSGGRERAATARGSDDWRRFDSLSSFANDDDLNERTGLLMQCFVSGNGDGVVLDALDDGTGLFHIWFVLKRRRR